MGGKVEAPEFGIYVHIPVLPRTRCDYCAFVTTVGKLGHAAAYVEAVVRDIERVRGSSRWRTPSTVYIGGGTPSLLPLGGLTRILATIDAPPDAEVTVEVNPESTRRRNFSKSTRKPSQPCLDRGTVLRPPRARRTRAPPRHRNGAHTPTRTNDTRSYWMEPPVRSSRETCQARTSNSSNPPHQILKGDSPKPRLCG